MDYFCPSKFFKITMTTESKNMNIVLWYFKHMEM